MPYTVPPLRPSCQCISGARRVRASSIGTCTMFGSTPAADAMRRTQPRMLVSSVPDTL